MLMLNLQLRISGLENFSYCLGYFSITAYYYIYSFFLIINLVSSWMVL